MKTLIIAGLILMSLGLVYVVWQWCAGARKYPFKPTQEELDWDGKVPGRDK